MTRAMRTSRQGLELIKSFEGFRGRAVPLDPSGWMIGYGHTQTARRGLVIGETDAANILKHHDLPPIEAAMGRLVLAPIHQNQFDALVSFAFNLGITTFRTSDVLAFINAGEPLKAAAAMGAWRKAEVNGRLIIVDALVRRRAIERALFLESPRGRPVASSPLIRPERDTSPGEYDMVQSPLDVRVDGGGLSILEAPEASRDTASEPVSVAASDPGIDETAITGKGPSPAPGLTAEETARRIGERVTRILGDPPDVPATEAPPAAAERRPGGGRLSQPSPSADDIAAAVAALADAQDGGDPAPPAIAAEAEDDDGDGDDDDTASSADLDAGRDEGSVPEISERPVPDDDQRDAGSTAMAPGHRRVIDDLEEVDVSALKDPGIGDRGKDWGALTAFGLAGCLGGLFALWGGRQVGRVARGEADFTDQWQMLIGPFAVVLGTVLAAIMVYYILRELLRR